MKVTKAELTVIDIPLSAPYLSSQNHAGKVSTSRTIVRLSTDEGFTGVGETNGTPEVVALLKRMCQDAIGHDVHDVRGLRRRTLPNVYGNYNGRNGWIAYAGLEMAFWDAAGKAMGLSLSQMLGGAFRDSVEVAGLMSAFPMNRAAGADLGSLIKDERNVELVVSEARSLVEAHGFRALKIKSAGLDWRWDSAVMRALREEFGPRMELRLDPNGAFTINDSLRLAKAVEDLDLEYLEDPTRGIEGMARLRRDSTTHLATNMCVIDFEQLPVAIRARAVDVILGDVYHWGGIQGFSELAAVCSTFGIDMGVHSFIEAGVGSAVNLHLAAVLPVMNHAIDGMLHFQDVSITRQHQELVDGRQAVPRGPGLGVELDEEVIADLTLETHVIDR